MSWDRIQENTGHSVNRGPLAGDMWAMLETFYLALIYVCTVVTKCFSGHASQCKST